MNSFVNSLLNEITPTEIITLWFSEAGKKFWYNATSEMDKELREKYSDIFHAAMRDRLEQWQDTPEGSLALVIVLDQFPLNMYRGEAESYSGEARSREVAAAAIARGFDEALIDEQKAFLYLPYMHSENLDDQDRAIELFTQAGLMENLKWAEHHREIVRRFGRFPHRNDMLGRKFTPEEEDYMKTEQAFHG